MKNSGKEIVLKQNLLPDSGNEKNFIFHVHDNSVVFSLRI